METKEMNLEDYARPEGIEVKIGTARITVIGLAFLLVLLVVGCLLFNYVWGDYTTYSAGYELGHYFLYHACSLQGVGVMILCFVLYILIQYGLIYWFSGKDHKAVRKNWDNKTIGFLLVKPLALKYYRIVLLTPFVLMGVLPAIHGFCTGNMDAYFIGLFCITASIADCYYFWKLRSFSGNDKIVDGKVSLSGTIIKASY